LKFIEKFKVDIVAQNNNKFINYKVAFGNLREYFNSVAFC